MLYLAFPRLLPGSFIDFYFFTFIYFFNFISSFFLYSFNLTCDLYFSPAIGMRGGGGGELQKLKNCSSNDQITYTAVTKHINI